MTRLDGSETVLSAAALDAFTASFHGRVVQPTDSDYDDVRAIWNAMIDRRPGLVAQCADAEDVRRSVQLARTNGLLVSVRGAGHNIAGSSLCDGGLLIDLSEMKQVVVDPDTRTARVQPGVTLGEMDAATQQHGLATPVGINSTTGVAGLTLGGGFGWISRKHGLTVDNLLQARVVTADGQLVTASETSHPELFWGLRGGGGNFGVVTEFTYQLHPVGPEVLSGLIVYPHADAHDVLRNYRTFAAQAPDELTVWAVMRKAPPLPFLPESVHGTDILILALLYTGPMSEGEAVVRPLRDFGQPIADVVSPHPFTGFQAAFDPLLTPGARNYWKSHNFVTLSDELLDTLIANAATVPTPESEIFIAQLGGYTSRVPADATAYPHRDAAFVMNVHTRWQDAADDERCVAWARALFEGTTPMATGGVYVNFMPADEQGRTSEAFGHHYPRLAALKQQYDPGNLFRVNQNIAPTGA